MSHHQNIHGPCDACDAIFDEYPNFNLDLRVWFDALRRKYFDAHISCAGRGKLAQETDCHKGASKAHYGHSAHNYNAAIDIWHQLDGGAYDQHPEAWFKHIMTGDAAIGTLLTWYGAPGSEFPELGHVQLSDWRARLAAGKLKLVE